MKDEEYQALICTAWETENSGVSPVVDVQSRLSEGQKSLMLRSRRKFKRATDTLKKKKEQLLELQRCASPDLDGAIKILQAEIKEILEREDMWWKKRSKQNWYLHGDRKYSVFPLVG